MSIAAGVRSDRGTRLGTSLTASCPATVTGLTSLQAQEGILAVTRVGHSPVAVTIDPIANEAFVVNKGSQEVTDLGLQTCEIKIRYAVGARGSLTVRVKNGTSYSPRRASVAQLVEQLIRNQ